MARFKTQAEYDLKDKTRQDTLSKRSYKKRNEKDRLTDGQSRRPKQNTDTIDAQSLKKIKSINDALVLLGD